MKKDEKILNNSLKELLEKFSNTDVIPTIENNYNKESINYVNIELIDDNQFLKKARINDSNLKEFEQNIIDNGLIRPFIIRKIKSRYEVVIGRRFFIACKKLKIKELPCIVASFTDEETLLILLADALEQRSYNIIEIAYLINYLNKKYGYKNVDLAKIIKKSPGQVSNILTLLNLPKDILKDVVNNKLSYGHAKAISRLKYEDAVEIKNRIYKEELSVRETEDLVRKLIKKDEICRVLRKKDGIYIKTYDQKLIDNIENYLKSILKN